MKKRLVLFLSIVLVLTLSLSMFACKNSEYKDTTYTIVAPDGAPSLSIVDLLVNSKEYDCGKVEAKVVAPSTISTEAVSSDFAVVPANLAANLFNKGKEIKLIASVTNGNLYMISSKEGTITDLEQLKGKLIYSIGKGAVPDLVFKSLLKNAQIEVEEGDESKEGKVVISYKDQGSEVIPLVVAAKNKGEEVYGILGEPAVTNAKSKGVFESYDLQSAWKTYTNSSIDGYPQAVLIAKKSICENNPEIVSAVVESLKNSKNVLISNNEESLAAIKNSYESTSLPAKLAETVINRCNINVVETANNKEYFVKLYSDIFSINPGAIGGQLPSDTLYY